MAASSIAAPTVRIPADELVKREEAAKAGEFGDEPYVQVDTTPTPKESTAKPLVKRMCSATGGKGSGGTTTGDAGATRGTSAGAKGGTATGSAGGGTKGSGSGTGGGAKGGTAGGGSKGGTGGGGSKGGTGGGSKNGGR